MGLAYVMFFTENYALKYLLSMLMNPRRPDCQIKEFKILGNFNVLLLRRRIMSSGNAVRGRLSLLLVSTDDSAEFLAIFSYQTENGHLR